MQQVEMDSVRPSVVDRFLSLFANVKSGEGLTAFLLMINVFSLLTAYYASAGQALLFLLIVPLYGMLGSRVSRLWLINGVTAFFILNLAIFYVLGQAGASLGVVFYLWVGLFNLMLVAQFWAFANDIYTQKQGERLFGVVGIGASLGAILGAWLAGMLFEPVGAYTMMLMSAALLGLSMILTNWIHHREERATAIRDVSKTEAAQRPLGTAGGFQLILKSRYLLLIAFLVLISNCVNTTGEFILGKTVEQNAQTAIAGSPDAAAAEKNFIGQFYANFYFWVNLIGAGLQMFLVSRIMQAWGAGVALFFLPIIAFGGYVMLALVPILSLIRIAKIVENTVDYSIQNTARHALFLSTSREAKYKAKAAIDSFFWRTGDTISGLLVFTGTQLALSIRGFAAINVVLVVVWLAIAFGILRHVRKESVAAKRTAA
jgi:AAA family ATP:ADP antiporter